jgi:TusA-related sulfurtransferase
MKDILPVLPKIKTAITTVQPGEVIEIYPDVPPAGTSL